MTQTDQIDSADAKENGSIGKQTARLVLVTGVSGAGRTTTLKILEDFGFDAVDNLPLRLLPNFLVSDADLGAPCAIGLDIRTRDFGVDQFADIVRSLRAQPGLELTLLFVDADTTILQRRFTETRRPHPLTQDRPLIDAITHEKRLMAPIATLADMIIDTSRLKPAELRMILLDQFHIGDKDGMSVFVKSFSFRQGLPGEADLVFDVRFLRNPHYDPELRVCTGLDDRVGRYIEQDGDFAGFMTRLKDLIAPILPRYAEEGKSYLTIAIGCTGGQHRSVYIARLLNDWIGQLGYDVHLSHRDKPAEPDEQKSGGEAI
ncbi:RNase adapter RapZ [Thalassospira sp.]|uniref:RNase adapter RapZ n=1 Tax=Thalassospira sp. TaxID=1912094 RepID=UPI002737380E|nr:RNase adapter RapZ [Thalassospira sp.]MDP2700310.1 RNase adapter RapZ [Thalassospira sp.]